MRESVAIGRSLLGGNGIVTDFEMAKIFADAEAIYSYEGTHEINTLVTGRAITGSPPSSRPRSLVRSVAWSASRMDGRRSSHELQRIHVVFAAPDAPVDAGQRAAVARQAPCR